LAREGGEESSKARPAHASTSGSVVPGATISLIIEIRLGLYRISVHVTEKNIPGPKARDYGRQILAQSDPQASPHALLREKPLPARLGHPDRCS
jgi:hypothetical protein